jgi:hypothetical protein
MGGFFRSEVSVRGFADSYECAHGHREWMTVAHH